LARFAAGPRQPVCLRHHAFDTSPPGNRNRGPGPKVRRSSSTTPCSLRHPNAAGGCEANKPKVIPPPHGPTVPVLWRGTCSCLTCRRGPRSSRRAGRGGVGSRARGGRGCSRGRARSVVRRVGVAGVVGERKDCDDHCQRDNAADNPPGITRLVTDSVPVVVVAHRSVLCSSPGPQRCTRGGVPAHRGISTGPARSMLLSAWSVSRSVR
jgi:hypothetical protein